MEAAACARRLAAMANVLDRRMAATVRPSGAAALDNWDAVCAEIAAAQNITLRVASNQLLVAAALRAELPQVAEVFAGQVGYRLVAAIVARTMLIEDRETMAKVDTELAAGLEIRKHTTPL